MLRDDQTRLFEAYQSTFSDAVAVQSQSLGQAQDAMHGLVESLHHVYGGLEEVSKPHS